MDKRLTDISRTLSHALRHDPGSYGLTLDAEGWVSLDDMVAAFHRRSRRVSRADIEQAVSSASKQRHEIRDGRIRAVYGHSVATRIEHTPATPPPVLYHGTAPGNLTSVLADGLLPMGRQQVHMATDVEMARSVGSRHASCPVILRIDAAAAHEAGIRFHRGSDRVWMAGTIPARHLSEL